MPLTTRTRTEYIISCDSCTADLPYPGLTEKAVKSFAVDARWHDMGDGRWQCRKCYVLANPPEVV